MDIIKKIDKAIKQELKESKKWYKDYLYTEFNIKIHNLQELEDAMNDIDPDNETENCIFSAGYIMGMRHIKRLIQEIK